MKKLFIIIILLIFSLELFGEETINISLKSVPLKTALIAIGKSLNKEVLISDQINSHIATMNIKKIGPKQLLKIIANKYDLKIEENNQLLIIHTQKEWQERQIRINEMKPLYFATISLRYAKSNDVIAILTGTNHFNSKQGILFSDPRTNAIFIHDTEERIALLKKTIRALDRPQKQLLLETYLVSMDQENERELGLTLKENNGRGLSINKWQFSGQIDVMLTMLEKRGSAEILSSPRLFTTDQETATIETGEEIPYQESSENGGTTTTFKKAVLGLKITPHILPHGHILLNLQMNHDRPSNRQVKEVPMISTRQIQTNVVLKNKETIILGGIFESDYEQNHSGIIGLNKIPIIGRLFQREMLKNHKRELLIFVTPIIMNDDYERNENR